MAPQKNKKNLRYALEITQEHALKEAKIARTKFYNIKVPRTETHEFCPILFDEQYFSLINMCFHSICLDYRFRSVKMQLSEFSKLSEEEIGDGDICIVLPVYMKELHPSRGQLLAFLYAWEAEAAIF